MLKDGDFLLGEILLITDVLVAGYKQIKLWSCLAEQLAVGQSSPSATLHRCAVMFGQMLRKRLWDRFVQQYFHAGASSACSERSKT